MGQLSNLRRSSFYYLFISLLLLLLVAPVSADSINAVFNEPSSGSQIEQTITSAIAGASQSIDLAAFSISSDAVVDGLVDAHEQGVDVRVITEADNRDDGGMYDGPAGALNHLEQQGIPVKVDDRSAFMHHKFMVIDGQTVVAGSANFTEEQFYGDKNNVVVIESGAVSHAFTQEFEEMWAGRFGSSKNNTSSHSFTVDGHNLSVLFSPSADVTDFIVNSLQSVDGSVVFNIFTFTEDRISDRFRQLHENGVPVRGTFDAWQATSRYSEYEGLDEDRIPVRRDDFTGLLHEKYMALDAGQSDGVVLTGSYNWTSSADASNEEFLLAISDPVIVSDYHNNAMDVYRNHARIPDWQEEPEFVVNINQASVEELKKLDGIGTTRANAIVDDREQEGLFYNVDQLERVSGIGEATVDNLRPQLTVGDVEEPAININQASASQLQQLDGIGPALAEAVVSDREANGLFLDKQDLTRVSGIGSSTLEGIKNKITVGDVPDIVDINSAGANELQTLPEIGEVLAENIVSHRDSVGVFYEIDDLLDVNGIDSATLDKIRNLVTVGDAAPPKININTATSADLQSLSGIGPSTAQAILDYRSGNGDFSTVDQLTNVSGIGNFTLEMIRDRITVE